MMAVVGAQYLVVVAEVAVVALVVVAVTAVVVEVGVGAVVVVAVEVTVIAPVTVNSVYSEDQTDKDEDLCSINAVFRYAPGLHTPHTEGGPLEYCFKIYLRGVLQLTRPRPGQRRRPPEQNSRRRR